VSLQSISFIVIPVNKHATVHRIELLPIRGVYLLCFIYSTIFIPLLRHISTAGFSIIIPPSRVPVLYVRRNAAFVSMRATNCEYVQVTEVNNTDAKQFSPFSFLTVWSFPELSEDRLLIIALVPSRRPSWAHHHHRSP
jgi:hypothetical protein